MRTGESVILDEAAHSAFAEDPYIRERRTRAILCLPLINQGKLSGVIYLENNLTHSAFAPARIAVLKLLASQAAISLENATLFQALRENEQRFRDYLETASDMEDEIEARTITQLAWRFIPFLILCYFVAYLDRVNVGFAKLTMDADLKLSETAFGFGAGVFFLSYFLFEVPSNVILDKVGARIWIARIMFSWGVVSGAMAFIPASLKQRV